MKTSRNAGSFEPITITLETKEELMLLITLLNNHMDGSYADQSCSGDWDNATIENLHGELVRY